MCYRPPVYFRQIRVFALSAQEERILRAFQKCDFLIF